MADFPRPAPPPRPCTFLNMGAFFNISGRIRNRILLPLMNTFSSWAVLPSLNVQVISDIWQFMLSSASNNFPLYVSPVFVSRVTIWPSASWRTLIGTPIDILESVWYTYSTCKTKFKVDDDGFRSSSNQQWRINWSVSSRLQCHLANISIIIILYSRGGATIN